MKTDPNSTWQQEQKKLNFALVIITTAIDVKMFFQINVTPERKKKAAEPSPTVINSYNLILAPFHPPTRINLDTRLNSSVECLLTIHNSNNRHLTVSVSKVPPPERFINLSATEWSIQSDSSVTLIIKWEPKKEGSWRDVLQLSDSRRIKYNIPLILNCTSPSKATKKKATRRTRNASLVNRMSQPSVLHAINKRKRPFSETTDKENKSNNIGLNWMLDQAKLKKRRIEESPSRSLDFTELLDFSAFKFTPLKSSFNSIKSTPRNDNQFWQQSTVAVDTKVQMTLRKEMCTKVLKYLDDANLENENEDNNEFNDSLSHKLSTEVEKPGSEMSMLLDDIKFTPYKNSNKVAADSALFSDSFAKKSASKNATFEIKSTNGTEHYNTYKLSPTSTRNSCQLKPLCLAFGKNNLEFSTPLAARRNFDNLANKHARCSNKFLASQTDSGSAKACLEADLWVKSKNISLSPISMSFLHSTLSSMRNEDDDPMKIFANNAREDPMQIKPSSPLCLEVSPSKKSIVSPSHLWGGYPHR